MERAEKGFDAADVYIAGVGAILFLLLLLAGTLLFEEASISNGGGMMLLSCLCGGAMAGILGSRPKKKRKR